MQAPLSLDDSESKQKPIGFPVSAKKFWIMSLFTFSIYNLYWAYQNFRRVNMAANGKVLSGLWALFFPLSLFALLKGLQKTAAEDGGNVKLRSIRLAFSFFVLTVIGRVLGVLGLPIGAEIVSVLALIPLYVVQKQINVINAELRPEIRPDSRFTTWDLTGILLVCGAIAARTIIRNIHH